MNTARPTTDVIKGANGLVIEFANSDLSLITLGGRVVARGGWSLWSSHKWWYARQKPSVEPGSVVKRQLFKLGKNDCKVVHTHDNVRASYTYSVVGDRLSCQIRVEHLDRVKLPLRTPCFSGMRFPVSRLPQTNMSPQWNGSYMQHIGPRLMHPSWAVPIGASYLTDDWHSVSLHTERHLDRRKLFAMSFRQPGEYRAEEPVDFHVDDEVLPGEVKCFDVQVKFSKSTDWRVFLADYRDALRTKTGGIKYVPDHRPVAQFASADPTWVRADNPFGFHDIGGTSNFRRFDRPEGVPLWTESVAKPLVEMGGGGCIHWAIQGVHPRGAMYRPDFEIFPPEIEANLPALIKGFKDRGLRFGLCARPGEEAYRESYTSDGTYRLSPDSPSQMETLVRRFEKAKALGVDLYYFDTFGDSLDDVRIAKILRDVVGPDVPIYSEYCCDLMLPYTGRYTEYKPDGSWSFANDFILDAYRYLMPGTGILVQRRGELSLDTMGQRGLTPMFHDYETRWKVAEMRAFSKTYLRERAFAAEAALPVGGEEIVPETKEVVTGASKVDRSA